MYETEIATDVIHKTAQSLVNVVFRGQELLVTEYDLGDEPEAGGNEANIGFA